MVLANSKKQFLLHLESYLVYEKDTKCDIVINNVCYCFLLLFSVHFSVVVGISFEIAFKRWKLDNG